MFVSICLPLLQNLARQLNKQKCMIVHIDKFSGCVRWWGCVWGEQLVDCLYYIINYLSYFPEEFSLRIENSQLEDDANYTCQVAPSGNDSRIVSRVAAVTVLSKY